MEENKNKGGMFTFFFKMLFIFILIDIVIASLPSVITGSILNFKYGTDLIVELFYGIFALIVMLLFHNSYVFTNKHDNFKKSLRMGIPILVFAFINFALNALSLDNFIIGNLINVIIYCIFIGFAEEFLCRGWLQNEFIERYGDTKANVIKSIVCASIVFGSMHLINVLTTSQGLVFTILQVINAISLGFYLGVIYYKTKNIWSVIFLHAFYDFALFLGEVNMVKGCTTGTLSNDVILANTINIGLLSLFWILSSVYVIKKTNFKDAKASKKKKGNALLITGIVVFGIMSMIPFEMLAEGYEDAYICYEYDITEKPDNYILHFPSYEEYVMEHERESKTLIMSDDGNDFKEVIVLNKYNISVYVDKLGILHIKNNNTGYERKFESGISSYEVIENEDAFTILLAKDDLETTIYFSDYTIKNNMTNEDAFIDEIVESFIKYELPLVNEIGYITVDDSDYKYPVFYSDNNYFIIKNGDLFLMQ